MNIFIKVRKNIRLMVLGSKSKIDDGNLQR